MDKIRFLLLPGLWAALLAGCGKDGINEGPEYIPGQNGDIVFDIGFAPQARVSTGADFKSAWEDGDEIGVYAVTHGMALASSGNYIHNVKLTYDGTSWAQETPLYWPTTASGVKLDFYAYYPYDAGAANPTAIAFKVKADQGATADYNASELLAAKSNNNADGWAKGSTVGLTFSHALSMVQLTIGDAVGSLDANEDITVTLRSVRTGCALNLGTPEVVTADGVSNVTMYRVEQPGDADYNDSFTFRALIPAQTVAQGSSLFRIVNGDLLLTGSALAVDLTMTAGQAETFTQEMPNPDDGIIMLEANSYMVEPNGEAIYIPVSQANRVLTADGLDATTDGLGGVTADNFTVELVWGDLPVGVGGVLTKIGAKQYFGKGYIYVEPGVEGNAVICIKVGDVIKWSWHIWVTEPVGGGADTETGLTWMDRNLGAKSNTPFVNGSFDQDQWVKTLGLFYQWGRKDAFPGSDGANNQTYYIGDATTGTTAALPTGSYTDLPDLVQHPLNFAKNLSTYCGSLNVGINNKSWSGKNGEKTLFDPCPPGWKVPPFMYNNMNSWGVDNDSTWPAGWNNGRVFGGVNGTAALGHFYPAAGYRNASSGLPGSVGNSGYYWSTGPLSTTSGRYLLFGNSGVYPLNSIARSYGFAVRCVA